MNKFLKKSVGFFLFWVAITAILAGITRYLLSEVYDRQNFVFEDSISALVLGDLHTQTALDPKIIPATANCSATSEHYFYSYYKLKYLYAANPDIRTVFLGFSYHNLGAGYDKYLLPDDDGQESGQMYDRYWMILDSRAHEFIGSYSRPYVEAALKYDWGLPFKFKAGFYKKAFFQEMTRKDYECLGEFYDRSRSNLNQERLDLSIQRHYFDGAGRVQAFSTWQLQYLEEIIRFCQEHNIRLYLVKTPLHQRYRSRVPAAFQEEFERLSNYFAENTAAHHINLANLALPDTAFGDGDHVNSYGAKVVSEKVRDMFYQSLSSRP